MPGILEESLMEIVVFDGGERCGYIEGQLRRWNNGISMNGTCSILMLIWWDVYVYVYIIYHIYIIIYIYIYIYIYIHYIMHDIYISIELYLHTTLSIIHIYIASTVIFGVSENDWLIAVSGHFKIGKMAITSSGFYKPTWALTNRCSDDSGRMTGLRIPTAMGMTIRFFSIFSNKIYPPVN